MKKPGRPTIRMAGQLSRRLGVDIEPADIWYQEGFYRRTDTARWGAHYRRCGEPTLIVFSWDTMSECLRSGFNIYQCKDNPCEFEVSAREPGR
jgi:hypothetical protein